METSRILRSKELKDGHNIALVRYLTPHPNTMPESMKKDFHPSFDRSYEMIIGLDRVSKKGHLYQLNTHPKLSWYVDSARFKSLFEIIASESDFKTVSKMLDNYMVPDMNYKDTVKLVDGLLRTLG